MEVVFTPLKNWWETEAGISLGMRPANERCRYIVMLTLCGLEMLYGVLIIDSGNGLSSI